MTNRTTINHYSIDSEFYQLVNDELVPASVNVNEFWNNLTEIFARYKSPATKSTPAAIHNSVPLLYPRQALNALNGRWGSLYSALYHENAIPHTAGLKTGVKYNVARGSRVTSYAKEILDSAFPLTEGSHKDAVSYLVYFKNLMLILADGSTVGLKNPAHFAAKSGPKSEPDSIFLKNPDIHVEICFDRRGANGTQDIASIDDIRIEAPADTAISLRANNIAEKCQIYRNLQALVRGELKATFDHQGKRHSRCLNHSNSYTAKCGENYDLDGCNPMVLQPHASDSLNIIFDQKNRAVPSALIDLIVTCLIQTNTKNCLAVSLHMPHDALTTQTVLKQLSTIPGMPAINLTLVTDTTDQSQIATEKATPAESLPEQISCIGGVEEALENPVTSSIQNGAVLKAIHHFSA